MRTIRPLLLIILLLTAATAGAETFILPHILDTSGGVGLDRAPGTTDTVLHFTYPSALAEGILPPAGDQVSVWVMSHLGTPYVAGDGTAICAPCTLPMGTNYAVEMSLIEVMVAAGVQAPAPEDGYLVIETSGPGTDQLAVTAETRLFLEDGTGLPIPLALRVPCGGGGGGQSTGKRTFVFPHILETEGSASDQDRTFDTTLFITYAGSLDPTVPDPGAAVDIYLFDETTGAPLLDGLGGEVCNPCSMVLGDDSISPRKRKINIEALVTAAGGGMPSPSLEVLAVAVATGDADNVVMTQSTVHSRCGAGCLSVFVFEPNEIRAAQSPTAAADVARAYVELRNHPDPFNPRTTLSFSLDREGPATLRIVDLKGRRVRTLEAGRLPAGDHALVWDGRDDDGSPQPAGVYLARLETAGFTTVEKMTLLK